MRTTFYIAGKYSSRERLCEYASQLRGRGAYVNSEWLEGTHSEATTELSKKAAVADIEDIRNSDYFVMFNDDPTSPGRNVELGYALALGKGCFIVGSPTSVFHHIVQCFPTVKDFFEYVDRYLS